MFRIALIGTISVIVLLAAGTIASAKGLGPLGPTSGSGYGHTVSATNDVGRMSTSDTTSPGSTSTMPGSSQTMGNYIAHAGDQMRARAAQMAAAANMQPATGMDPGYGMQSGTPGTGSTGSGMGSTTGMGSTSGTGTTGSGTHMGTTGTGTARTGSSGSMMGR